MNELMFNSATAQIYRWVIYKWTNTQLCYIQGKGPTYYSGESMNDICYIQGKGPTYYSGGKH